MFRVRDTASRWCFRASLLPAVQHYSRRSKSRTIKAQPGAVPLTIDVGLGYVGKYGTNLRVMSLAYVYVDTFSLPSVIHSCVYGMPPSNIDVVPVRPRVDTYGFLVSLLKDGSESSVEINQLLEDALSSTASTGSRLQQYSNIFFKLAVFQQVHLDSLLAQRLAEEEELSEQQKKRRAQVQFEAQHYTDEDLDLIRAKIKANAELSKSMLGSDLQGEDFAKKMVDLVNQRKKFFAEERARTKTYDPITAENIYDELFKESGDMEVI
ncbi:hypothetical protein Tco_1001256 [Tanacetum coccineum]